MVITPAGELGGIGIYSLHSEFSARDAREGVKDTRSFQLGSLRQLAIVMNH